ncbi:MAG: PadR family transcriptional regulator [Micromonosporaceae bacterium]|jgi:DNA-binding PadR family transcriptional regulator|nr:PadR family transcriptional regulator [Micromonosporaceae bacterium]
MILGLLRWTGPTHGYDIRRELLSWEADRWANLQPGSLYHALRKMTEEGLLREVSTEQVGARPARTTYEITARGEDEFQNLLHSAWWRVESRTEDFLAAFTFVSEMPRDEAAAALRSRAAYLRSANQRLHASKDSDWIRLKPANVRLMFDLWAAQAQTEIAWCERVAELVESGVAHLPEELGTAGGQPPPASAAYSPPRSSNSQA